MSNALSHSNPTAPFRRGRLIAALLGIGIGLSCVGEAAAQAFTHPSAAFVQSGSAQGTRALTVGLSWDLPYRWRLGPGELSSYLEASYAYWQIQSADRAGLSHLSQFALIPVLRYRPADGASPWFFEAGLGLTATSSVYRTRQKSFSTSFNFGTHLAVGRSFGERRQHEIALRLEHFSNAGIKHPNPGENFVQIRYTRRF
jgi:lipid A 3-O-deacylase